MCRATRDTRLEEVHCAVPAIAERFDVAATLLHLLVELACNPQEAAVGQLSPEGTTVPSGELRDCAGHLCAAKGFRP